MATLIPVRNSRPVLVDDADADRVLSRRWYAVTRNGAVYAESSMVIDGKREQVMLHRFIAQPPQGLVVDHINRDTLDNRRENLRVCTQRENARNRVGRIEVAGYKGVQLRYGRWRARIMVDRREICLGTHDTPEAAAAAYNAAAVEHFGQFAQLNVFGADPAEQGDRHAA